MPEYKRWVSYIYYYENNIKKNNIGYIRVEMKGDATKLTVHINVLSVTEPMNVYMCVRDSGKLKGVKIGEVIMDKGVGHSVYNVETSNIMNSNQGIEKIAGIIILHSKDKFYASEWDEDIIDIDSFEEYSKDVKAQNIEEISTPENEAEKEKIELSYEEKNNGDNKIVNDNRQNDNERKNDREQVNERKEEHRKEHINEHEGEHMEERMNEHEEHINARKEDHIEDHINERKEDHTKEHINEQKEKHTEKQMKGHMERQTEAVVREPERGAVENKNMNDMPIDGRDEEYNNEKYRQYIGDYRMADETTEKEKENNMTDEISEAAEKMLKTFPYMYPFEDDEIDACVRIEPQDIANLPIDTWLLANNSFLLKGYYGYRHLIFIKIGGNQPKYMIGVPGINHNRESFLANMFGFRLFKPIKNTSEVKGEFGYWCIGLENRYI